MLKMDEIQKRLLEEIADLHDIPAGAYNLRAARGLGRPYVVWGTHLDEIRKVRDEISRECGYEPRKLVSYYKRLQKEDTAARSKRRPAKAVGARRP